MRIERSTVSLRRLGVAVAAVALGAVVLVAPAGARRGGPAPTAPPAADPADRGGAHSPAPTGGPPAAAVTPRGAAPAVADEPADAGAVATSMAGDQELAAARQVAGSFAAGLASYRYDDPPDAAVARVAPYATAELAAELGRNSGAPAGRGELAARQEVAVGVVEAVQTDTASNAAMDLLVVVRQHVTSLGGGEVRVASYLVKVVRTPDGWRVTGFQP